MIAGIILDPEQHPDWPQIEAFLKPAAIRGGGKICEPHFALWAVYDGPLVGAATARLTKDGYGEVVLLGGHDCKRWLSFLDDRIGAWMKSEGMKSVRAYGRMGWVRRLINGWHEIDGIGNDKGYERQLA